MECEPSGLVDRASQVYKICPHCEGELSLKRYMEHKRLFFNRDTNQWMKEICDETMEDDGSGSDFSCFEERISREVSDCEGDNWQLDDEGEENVCVGKQGSDSELCGLEGTCM